MNGDLSAFKRPYTGFIKRCDELERILRFIEAEMKAQGIKPQVSATTEAHRKRYRTDTSTMNPRACPPTHSAM